MQLIVKVHASVKPQAHGKGVDKESNHARLKILGTTTNEQGFGMILAKYLPPIKPGKAVALTALVCMRKNYKVSKAN